MVSGIECIIFEISADTELSRRLQIDKRRKVGIPTRDILTSGR